MITKPLFYQFLSIVLVFVISLLLRTYSLNWDNHTHLHPDERFLTMVSTTIHSPQSLAHYFDTSTSTLNPTNYPDYKFFVYGTFPLFLTRWIGEVLNLTGYDQIHLVGRFLSALFDSFIVFGLFSLSKLLFPKKEIKILLIPSVFYAFSVLPLQLSHYYAVDTFLSAFIFYTFLLLVLYIFKNKFIFIPLAGFIFGLALASKITALLFLPVVGLVFLININFKTPSFLVFRLFYGIVFVIFALVSFRLFQPYAFDGLLKLNPVFIENLQTLSSQSQPNAYFPPSVQWLSKTKILFPLQNIVFWGMGLPAVLLLSISIFKTSLHQLLPINKTKLVIAAVIFWILFLFFYQGTRFTFAMRYFLPIYPFIFLVIGYYSATLKYSKLKYLLVVLHIIWSFAFLNVYSHPQSRLTASAWIYDHILPGARITNEYWDDPLPLYLPDHHPYIYQGEMLPLYDPESNDKWVKLNSILSNSDYHITSSNRLWGSITKVPNLYPNTTIFYNHLFDEVPPYKLVYRHVVYPGFSLPFLTSCHYFGFSDYPYVKKTNYFYQEDKLCPYPGIYFRDDTADESFTVYDHPQINIFQRR